jgi:hypothetical protein
MRLLYLISATEFGKGAYREYWRNGWRQNFLIWMGLWIAAFMVLLPALASS